MFDYRLYRLNHMGKIAQAPTVISAPDDGAALADARRILKPDERGEVWHSARLVGRVRGG